MEEKKRKTRGKGGEKRKEKKTKKEGKRTEENRKGGGRWPARWFRLCFTSMKTSGRFLVHRAEVFCPSCF